MNTKSLAIFNGTRMAEFSPDALVSELYHISGDIHSKDIGDRNVDVDDKDITKDTDRDVVKDTDRGSAINGIALSLDSPLTEQITIEPNTPIRLNDNTTALLSQASSRYFSTIGINPVRIGSSPCDHIKLESAGSDSSNAPAKVVGLAGIALHNCNTLSVLCKADVFLNGIKIPMGDYAISPGDTIWINHTKIIPHIGYIEVLEPTVASEAALITSSGVTGTGMVSEQEAGAGAESGAGAGVKTKVHVAPFTSNLNISTKTPEPYIGFPDYKRSPRIIKRQPTDELEIKSPPKKEKEKKWALLKVILPPMMTSMIMVGGSMLMGRGLFVLISAAAMVVSVIFSTTMFISDRKEKRKKQETRDGNYDKYLLEQRKAVHRLYEAQRESLLYHYLSPKEIEQEILSYSSRIYERSANDGDFLTLSLGYGAMATSFKLKYEADADNEDKDPLIDEMKELGASYKDIPSMPMVVDLKNAHLGLVGDKTYIHRQLAAIMTQLCFYQSYHDIEIITLLEEEHRPNFEWLRWYPHLRIKNINVTGLISTENHRDQALGNIAQVLKMRKQKQDEEKKDSRYLPHYVFIIDNPKLIINHSIMEYLQTPDTSLGFSLIYTTHLQANLPENIKTVFLLTGGEYGTLIMNEGVLLNTAATLPSLVGVDLEAMSRKIAPLRHSQGISTQIPESVTFFELYGVKRPEEIPILQLWSKNACHKSLAVPLGLRGKDDIVSLNLHEKAHGPHGLVAGTTGSGKSEIVQSYILSLAVNFHPHEVGFLLIDYKGGGMANLFTDLPHLLGTITNLDGSESMRALASIKSELARRQRIFNDHNVNNINQYTKLFKANEATLPMPHLFIISDEFAELKKEQPDFMSELVSTARIGRSLGVHLILATQKPTGVVDDQIWSNSKFKLALKVANESDSNEVLKTPDAARITQPGRSYLQVGNNEIYELFQSAYSGAAYSEAVVERGFDSRVYMINRLGQGVLLNEDLSLVDTAEDSRLTQLDVTVSHIRNLHVAIGSVAVDKPWLPPLEGRIVTPHIGTMSNGSNDADNGTNSNNAHIGINGNADGDSLSNNANSNIIGVIVDGTDLQHNASAVSLQRNVGQITTLNLSAPLGIMDIPEEQRQTEYTHNFTDDGNLAVFAASGFGKSTVVMNIALTLAASNSPNLLNYFVLDYGNSALAQLRSLPHTADYLSIDDAEKLEKLEKHLADELKRRKQLFAGVSAINFKMYNDVAEQKLPAIIIFIDNSDIIREVSENLEDSLVKLSRDGAGVGIYVVITASRPGAVRYSVLNNFKSKIAMYMYDSSDIATTVGRSAYQLTDTKGRALIKPGTSDVHITQLYLPVAYEDEMSYVRLVGNVISDIDKFNTAPRAVGIRIVPEIVTYADLVPYIEAAQTKVQNQSTSQSLGQDQNKALSTVQDFDTGQNRNSGIIYSRTAILGFDTETTEPTYLDLTITSQMVVGGPASGKTNVLRLIAKQFAEPVIETSKNEISEFNSNEANNTSNDTHDDVAIINTYASSDDTNASSTDITTSDDDTHDAASINTYTNPATTNINAPANPTSISASDTDTSDHLAPMLFIADSRAGDMEDYEIQAQSLAQSQMQVQTQHHARHILDDNISDAVIPGAAVSDVATCNITTPNITYMSTETHLENFYNTLNQETNRRLSAHEASGQRIRDFIASQPPALVLIDDGDNFIELCKLKEYEMQTLITKAKEMGITFITTTLPSKMRGYDAITALLKDNQAGVILGNPSDQSFLQVPAPRNYKPSVEIGFWFKRGEVRVVKVPGVI